MHYVLSDIHGNSAAFDGILDMIKLQPNDHLYVLGDVVDRGPDGIELLQRIRRMENCELLLGNHEYMMINAMRNPDNYRLFRLWWMNGCENTYQGFLALSKSEQEELLKFLEGLPLQTEIEVNGTRYILVHAAPVQLFPTEGEDYPDERKFAVWHRLPMTKPEGLGGKTLIFGHTPTEYMQFSEFPMMRIAHGDGVIDIDCGYAYPTSGGQLGCLRLEDGMEFYSKEGKVTRAEAAAWRAEQMEAQKGI